MLHKKLKKIEGKKDIECAQKEMKRERHYEINGF